MTYKDKLIDLLKSDDEVKTAMYDSFYKCDYDLQERFIRMYCENKKINIAFSNTELWHLNGDVILPIICKLDNTKDFDNQDDTIYQKIYEALNKLIP